MNTQRFKNYGLWLAIGAFIPMLLEAFGVKILPANYDELFKALLAILVLAGIINDPNTESTKGFGDDPRD